MQQNVLTFQLIGIFGCNPFSLVSDEATHISSQPCDTTLNENHKFWLPKPLKDLERKSYGERKKQLNSFVFSRRDCVDTIQTLTRHKKEE